MRRERAATQHPQPIAVKREEAGRRGSRKAARRLPAAGKTAGRREQVYPIGGSLTEAACVALYRMTPDSSVKK